MQWARYGPDKKPISAKFYREEKHGEVICRYCDGKMTVVRGSKEPHFRVVDRKTHTCKYFGNEIEQIVEACRLTVRLDRKNHESPVFYLNFENDTSLSAAASTKKQDSSGLQSKDAQKGPAPSRSMVMYTQEKLKTKFKFVHDIYELILRNEYERVLHCRFVMEEKGEQKKIKSEDLIPNYKSILRLHEKGTLGERKRFIIGTVLGAKETVNGNIEVTLYGEKVKEKGYINHKIIFMKKVIEECGLHLTDFFKDRTLITYAKAKVSDSLKEVISFVGGIDDFEFGKLTAKDGDWVDSKDEKQIDNFFFYRNIAHDVPDLIAGRGLFPVENGADHFYVPDWILYLKEKRVIVEYFGYYTDEYLERKQRKIQYFSGLQDYEFIALEKDDLENGYAGLKRKLRQIQPNLQLDLFGE